MEDGGLVMLRDVKDVGRAGARLLKRWGVGIGGGGVLEAGL